MTAPATSTPGGLSPVKSRLRDMWMDGDYDTFSRFMEKGAEEFYLGLRIPPGAKLLDVGCGSGQLALIAARHGARATGCDIASNWLVKARQRARAAGLEIVFEEGDAEALPYPDASFDVVASLVGAMFAPHPELVAAELTRVCRPGGRIVMANWTPQGFIGQMLKTTAKHLAPNGLPSPLLWGDESTVRARLQEGLSELRLTRRRYPFVYPFAPAQVVEFFRTHYGPMRRAFEAMDAAQQASLRAELVALWSAENRSVNGGTEVHAEYLEIAATRA